MLDRTFAAGAIAAAMIAGTASATIISTFDNDAEGWGILNDATNFAWSGDIGNPPGAIRATDLAQGPIWYFSASNAYLGNKSGYYGGELSWDISLLVGNHNLSSRADVMLVGGGMAIGIDASVDPVNGQWTSWSVALDTSSDWRHVNQLSHGTLTTNAVTAAQFQTVLADLTGLFIRGEYTNGNDAAALDNVMLLPAPGAVTLLGLGLAARRRRRC